MAVIEPKLRPCAGDTDVCVMWNTVVGAKDGRITKIDYYLWDEADTQNGTSAMAQITGFSAAIGALFIGRGAIMQKGIIPPENVIKGQIYEAFMDELEKRGIKVIDVPEIIDQFDLQSMLDPESEVGSTPISGNDKRGGIFDVSGN